MPRRVSGGKTDARYLKINQRAIFLHLFTASRCCSSFRGPIQCTAFADAAVGFPAKRTHVYHVLSVLARKTVPLRTALGSDSRATVFIQLCELTTVYGDAKRLHWTNSLQIVPDVQMFSGKTAIGADTATSQYTKLETTKLLVAFELIEPWGPLSATCHFPHRRLLLASDSFLDPRCSPTLVLCIALSKRVVVLLDSPPEHASLGLSLALPCRSQHTLGAPPTYENRALFL